MLDIHFLFNEFIPSFFSFHENLYMFIFSLDEKTNQKNQGKKRLANL